MSTEIVHFAGGLPEKMEYAKALAASGMLPQAYKQQPANVLVAVELGGALGIAPIVAINEINVINGTPSPSASLMASLARAAGHTVRTWNDDDGAGVCEIVRKDDPEFTHRSRWDEAKARQAGYWGKGHWSKDPQTMMRWRAISECVRMACPEVLGGLKYTPEEAYEIAESRKPPTYVQNEAPQAAPEAAPSLAPVDAEPIAWADPDNTINAIGNAQTPADLVAIGTEIKGRLREADRERVTAAYKARAAQLAAPTAEPEPEPTLDEATETVQETLDAEVVE